MSEGMFPDVTSQIYLASGKHTAVLFSCHVSLGRLERLEDFPRFLLGRRFVGEFWVDFIVYNRPKVHKVHQNFLKVVVPMIIIDQWNQTARLYELPVTVIYRRSILVGVTSEYNVTGAICKA